jgi:hypothetical protein
MTTIDRSRAIDAADVLNDFIGDFVTGVMVFREYSAQLKAGRLSLEMMVGIQKMCLSNIVLAFAKFEEFWKHYHDVVPIEHRDACKSILKAIRNRKITEFRNQVVGHIWNTSERRPLRHSEVMQALESMAAQDFGAFLDWINNPKTNTYPSTVVSIVEAVRDAIVSLHGIRPEEIVNR